MIVLSINQKEYQLDIEPGMPLLWVLRDELNLTGTKFGCGIASCGACSVLVDGEVVRSCVVPVKSVEGKMITTIEGLGTAERFTAIQEAWIEHQVPQCGYCQSGMIVAAEALLSKKPLPTDQDIDAHMTNICRCGTYNRIREAIHTAAQNSATIARTTL